MAKILPKNTLMLCSYMYLRLIKTPLTDFFTYIVHKFCPIVRCGNSESQTVLDITFICNV